MIKVKCYGCKKEIMRWAYQLKNNKNSYCSRKCQNLGIWKTHKSEIIKKQNIGKNKTSKKKTHICENCNKSFQHYYKTRRFCSKKCSSEFMVRENSQSWKGGLSSENQILRKRKITEDWRKEVFARDNYTCQKCGLHSGNGKAVILNAHHIKKWSEFPELRYDVDNGITLCYECHMEEHRK